MLSSVTAPTRTIASWDRKGLQYPSRTACCYRPMRTRLRKHGNTHRNRCEQNLEEALPQASVLV